MSETRKESFGNHQSYGYKTSLETLVCPKNIHNYTIPTLKRATGIPKEGMGSWVGSQKPKFLKESMKLNWDLQRGGGRGGGGVK